MSAALPSEIFAAPTPQPQGDGKVMSADMQRAAPLLKRYRDDYEKNRKLVEECERRNGQNCKAAGCLDDTDLGEDGMGGPSICVAPDDVAHAVRMEALRRQCTGTSGVWWVQVEGAKLSGDCICPRPGVAEVLHSGIVEFFPFQGGCLNERQLCTNRGGTFNPPKRPAAISAAMTAAVAKRKQRKASECDDVDGASDWKSGQFTYSYWIGPEKGGRCEVTALQGFRVIRKPERPQDREAKVVETSQCKMPGED